MKKKSTWPDKSAAKPKSRTAGKSVKLPSNVRAIRAGDAVYHVICEDTEGHKWSQSGIDNMAKQFAAALNCSSAVIATRASVHINQVR